MKNKVTPQIGRKSVFKPVVKGIACIPCTKNHLSTIAGALSEAVWFARSEGVSSDEVRRRIGIVEDELNIWERVDATPDKIDVLEPHEREVMREALRRGRELRHYEAPQLGFEGFVHFGCD
jgi:hypothetical protein